MQNRKMSKKRKAEKYISRLPVIIVTIFLAIAIVALASNLQFFKGIIQSDAAGVVTATKTFSAQNFANEDGTQVAVSGNSWIGTGKDRSSYSGIRFSGDAIPKNATIQNAKLELSPKTTQWIGVGVQIAADTDVNPKNFSPESKPSARILTANTKKYEDNVKWEKDTYYSYDVTSIVQELVLGADRSAIALVLKGTYGPYARKFINSTGSFQPKLTITYTTGAVATVQPTPTATPGSGSGGGQGGMGTHSPVPTATPQGGGSGGGTPDGSLSHAYGVWSPSSWDTCSKETHDKYSVVAYDGKRYPTWHPPVDSVTGCKFGHEHGRDPSGSDLVAFIRETYSTTGNALPFGLANEKLDEWNIAQGITNGMRHEDHVGHKIEWENNVELTRNACGNVAASPGCYDRVKVGVQCDFLMKVHQGTHSKDAFTNNMHELEYFVQCTDGTKIAATKMTLFGKPGEFTSNDKSTTIKVGNATPLNSIAGSGSRFIPTIDRIREYILVPNGKFSDFSQALYEDWLSANYITTSTGKQLAYFDPHFAVFSPSRYYDPSKPDNVGRSIDVCYMTEKLGLERARGGACDTLTNFGRNMTPIPYDDPRSPFNGIRREFYFNQTSITNTGGSAIWYTDPFGKNAKTTSSPGYIKQYIAPVNNTREYFLDSQAIGASRNYGGNGVHAPN